MFLDVALVEYVNVTILRTKSKVMVKRKAHIAIMQEANVPLHEVDPMK